MTPMNVGLLHDQELLAVDLTSVPDHLPKSTVAAMTPIVDEPCRFSSRPAGS
jgi:hypothetical protein